MHRPMTVKLWWALTAVLMTNIVMTAGSLIYTNNVAKRSAQQLCSVIITVDNSYKEAPPQTPVGKKFAQEMHDLRTMKLRCEE